MDLKALSSIVLKPHFVNIVSEETEVIKLREKNSILTFFLILSLAELKVRAVFWSGKLVPVEKVLLVLQEFLTFLAKITEN